ncbi:MAG: energy-coupled thiamine transporter ThiT, partial [Firmicutes bacterium]|nr:energy-coupled thiamine transporter ThiT [Bacillota bacterium]
MKSEKLKRLAVSAIMVALASVLSLIKVWQMPLGGSVTLLSMLPIVLVSVVYGIKQGLATSFVYA